MIQQQLYKISQFWKLLVLVLSSHSIVFIFIIFGSKDAIPSPLWVVGTPVSHHYGTVMPKLLSVGDKSEICGPAKINECPEWYHLLRMMISSGTS